MKQKFTFPRTAFALFLLILLCTPLTAFSQAPDVLDVEAVVCRDVVDRKPVGSDTIFPDSVEKLYCFSKILGAKTPTTISHVWYYGNAEMFRISLPVKSASWRTYSLKNIRSHETGSWHVEILDAAENKLEVINAETEKAARKGAYYLVWDYYRDKQIKAHFRFKE